MSNIVDVLTGLKTLLDANWNSANTDSLTPTIALITDVKEITTANGDSVLLYQMDEPIEPFGIGAQEWAHIKTARIDVRTTYQRNRISDIRAHAVKLKEEVLRIIKANTANPDANHELVKPRRSNDLSDKSVGLGRFVIDVEYWHHGS